MQTYWDRRDRPQVSLFHYGDLVADLPGQVRRLADTLSVDMSDERIEDLAAAASFERMHARANELAPGVNRRLWRDNRAFFRSGSSGQWHDLLGPSDLARYRSRIAELAAPDLVDWLHAGWLGQRDWDQHLRRRSKAR